ncbi:hypothetical protein [Actinokineospora sp. UTMC 2448]|uniref:hypothetical protein n=1 Tax=Actinokineospora sp. UTMC 2448 TaxID=2268449 RepID=UPI002164ED80|nr:hypothetical protein [Actinokineospora sp. UTMC 2448]UVS79614.1 hypothetical protein Actkin_03364 [Actinokineospora sp. UTMC 2448]
MSRSGAVLSVVLVASGVVAGGVPARAGGLVQTCVGTEVTSFDPPLTLVSWPTEITVSGLFPTCTHATARTASYAETFTINASCLVLGDSGTATRSFVWGDPAVAPSTFVYNVTSSAVGGQIVVTSSGLITDGTFAPAGAVQTVTLLTPNTLQCATTGIATVTGPTTVNINQ